MQNYSTNVKLIILFILFFLFNYHYSFCSDTISTNKTTIKNKQPVVKGYTKFRVFDKKTHLQYLDSLRQNIFFTVKYNNINIYNELDSITNLIETNRKKKYKKNIPSLVNTEYNFILLNEKDPNGIVNVKDYIIQVNRIRKLHKLKPLVLDKQLTQYAKKHTEQMMLKQEVYHSEFETSIGNYAENVSGIPDYLRAIGWACVNAYYDSPSHRFNLLNKSITRIGIYSYKVNGYEYNTMILK